MVQALPVDGEGDVTRCVFQGKVEFSLQEKATGVDSNEPIVVVAFGTRGYIAPYYKEQIAKNEVSQHDG